MSLLCRVALYRLALTCTLFYVLACLRQVEGHREQLPGALSESPVFPTPYRPESQPGALSGLNVVATEASEVDECEFNQQWSQEEKCNWSRRCSFDVSHISYSELSFCIVQSKSLSSTLLVIWLLILFWLTGTISGREKEVLCFDIIAADAFLTPAMVHLATLLDLSEPVAGCTVLAISNSVADIMSGATAAYSDPKQLGIFSRSCVEQFTHQYRSG